MWVDPIVEEVREIRDKYASRFNYNLDAIFRDLKKQEELNQRQLVRLPPRKPARGGPATEGDGLPHH